MEPSIQLVLIFKSYQFCYYPLYFLKECDYNNNLQDILSYKKYTYKTYLQISFFEDSCQKNRIVH